MEEEPRQAGNSSDKVGRGWWIGLAVVGAVLLIIGLWLYVRPDTAKEKKDFIQAVGILIAGLTGFIGLSFTWKSLGQTQRATQETLDLTQQGQITERFTQAIDQLGNENRDVRMGAIYALERIATNSERDYGTIMEILNTYVQEHARWMPEQGSDEEKEQGSDWEKGWRLPQDIQAALTVLGRRTRYRGNGDDRVINLQQVDLRGGNLREAHLEGANLWGSHLEKADLRGSRLKSADLRGATLNMASLVSTDIEKANLWRANLRQSVLLAATLERANLNNAILEGTYLQGANFKGANLAHATLDGAFIQGIRAPNRFDLSERDTDLRGARWLTQDQIERANGDDTTLLPDGLVKPSWWSKVPLADGRKLSPGRYTINVLKVALSFEIGQGWESLIVRWPEILQLGRRYWDLAFLRIEEIYDPSKPFTESPHSVPDDPIAWLQERQQPYLGIRETPPVAVGGVPGKGIDLVVTEEPKDGPWDFPRPVVLFCRTNSEYRARGARRGFMYGIKYRLIFLHVEGELVTISLGSREDKFDEAVRELETFLDTVEWTNLETWHLRDDLPEAWLRRSDELMVKGRNEEALEASERALSLNKDLPEGWLHKGWALTKLKRNEEALEASERALELGYNSPLAWLHKGRTLSGLGRNEEALEASDRALSLAYDFPEAWIIKSHALRSLGRNEEAFEAIEKAVRLEPDSPRIWLAKGWVLLDLGRKEEALAASEKVLSLAPDLWQGLEAEDLRDKSLVKANGQNETSE